MAADKILNCVECGLQFVFSEDEQQVHVRRGYGHEPRRCPPCRVDARARRRGQEEGASRRSQGESPAEADPTSHPPGPGHVTLCGSCGVEVFLPAPPGPGVPVLCDACRPPK